VIRPSLMDEATTVRKTCGKTPSKLINTPSQYPCWLIVMEHHPKDLPIKDSHGSTALTFFTVTGNLSGEVRLTSTVSSFTSAAINNACLVPIKKYLMRQSSTTSSCTALRGCPSMCWKGSRMMKVTSAALNWASSKVLLVSVIYSAFFLFLALILNQIGLPINPKLSRI